MSTSTSSSIAARGPIPRLTGRLITRRMLQRCAIALCLAMLAGLVGSYIALLSGGGAGPKQTDFVPYYSAAKLVGTGHGGAIYSFGPLGQLESSLVKPLVVKDGVMPYLYPPYFAAAMAPLAALPYTAAYLFWLLVNLILLGVSLAWLRQYAQLSGANAVLFWVSALSFLPVLVGLGQGQTSILLLALFTGSFAALRSGRQVLGGAVLACALIKPTYVLPVLVACLLHRKWRAVAAVIGTGAGLFLVPNLILGASINAGYGDTLLRASGWRQQIGGFEAKWNDSFAGSMQLLLPNRPAALAATLLCLAAVVFFAAVVWRSRSFDGAVALAIVVGLLVSPHVLIHDLTLLLIPAAVALRLRDLWNRATFPLLWAGYGAVLVGLALVTVIHLQLAVIAMTAFAIWLGLGMEHIRGRISEDRLPC